MNSVASRMSDEFRKAGTEGGLTRVGTRDRGFKRSSTLVVSTANPLSKISLWASSVASTASASERGERRSVSVGAPSLERSLLGTKHR